MAWTAPSTAVAGDLVTASLFNASVRDNLNATGVAQVTASGQIIVTTAANAVAARTPSVATVSTSETRTSTTYGDLATVGPTVTVTTGTVALVIFGTHVSNTNAGQGGRMAVDISGATTSAASDTNSVLAESGNANDGFQWSYATVIDSLTAGSNTFRAKYRLVGAGTATFSNRSLSIVPF